MAVESTQLEILSREESLDLLATVPVGRVVFTLHALPAIQPVNFVVSVGDVILRTAADSTLATSRSEIVAFEADEYDTKTRTGWYVAVTGHAFHVHDPVEVVTLSRLPLHPWAPGHRDHFIRIRPEIVSGRRIRPAPVRNAV